jgi:rSAM/selenodomain-associated transferase 2
LRVTVIVPALDEERFLPDCLLALAGQEALAEVIVVDGGSADATFQRAVEALARLESGGIGTLAIQSSRGRGPQLNAGAARARSDLLLFLHADTRLPAGGVASAANAARRGFVGGAFRHAFIERDPRLWMVSTSANLRSASRHLFFGDQAIFVRRDLFVKMGGFADIPIMEDVEFSARMRREGRTVLLSGRVLTSGRRFLRGGFWRTSARMILIRTAWRLGAHPSQLDRHYEVVR